MRRRSTIFVVGLFAALGLATLFYERHHKLAGKLQNSYEGIISVRVFHSISHPERRPEASRPLMAAYIAVLDAFLPFAQSSIFEKRAEERTLALDSHLKPCFVSVHIVEIPNPGQRSDSAWIDRLYRVSGQGKDDEYVRHYVDSLMEEIVWSCDALRCAARDEFRSRKASFLTDRIRVLRVSNLQDKTSELHANKQQPDDYLKVMQHLWPKLVYEILLADAQFQSVPDEKPDSVVGQYRELREKALILLDEPDTARPVDIMERAKKRQ